MPRADPRTLPRPSSPEPASELAVYAASVAADAAADALAERLGLPRCRHDPQTAWPWLLEFVPSGAHYRLQLRSTAAGAPGPVYAEFSSGPAAHRRRYGGGAGQALARALGLRAGRRPDVIDATAGLGRDACVLAGLGCRVTLLERSPVVAALLADGLQRAAADVDSAPIVARMRLQTGDARAYLSQLPAAQRAEVIYLDPMYPARKKSALVKKEMRVLRHWAGDDADAAELLEAALAAARRRVVVKRPRGAAPLAGRATDNCVMTKTTRYDLYLPGS